MTERQEDYKKISSVCGESWKYDIEDTVYGEKSETVHVFAYKDEGEIRGQSLIKLSCMLVKKDAGCISKIAARESVKEFQD